MFKQDSFKVNCVHCGFYNHNKNDCWFKNKPKNNRQQQFNHNRHFTNRRNGFENQRSTQPQGTVQNNNINNRQQRQATWTGFATGRSARFRKQINEVSWNNKTCRKCNQRGHVIRNCPDMKESKKAQLQAPRTEQVRRNTATLPISGPFPPSLRKRMLELTNAAKTEFLAQEALDKTEMDRRIAQEKPAEIWQFTKKSDPSYHRVVLSNDKNKTEIKRLGLLIGVMNEDVTEATVQRDSIYAQLMAWIANATPCENWDGLNKRIVSEALVQWAENQEADFKKSREEGHKKRINFLQTKIANMSEAFTESLQIIKETIDNKQKDKQERAKKIEEMKRIEVLEAQLQEQMRANKQSNSNSVAQNENRAQQQPPISNNKATQLELLNLMAEMSNVAIPHDVREQLSTAHNLKPAIINTEQMDLDGVTTTLSPRSRTRLIRRANLDLFLNTNNVNDDNTTVDTENDNGSLNSPKRGRVRNQNE